jgi:hypothetical protein
MFLDNTGGFRKKHGFSNKKICEKKIRVRASLRDFSLKNSFFFGFHFFSSITTSEE